MVDTLTDQVTDLQAAYVMLRNQRNQALDGRGEMEVSGMIQQRQLTRQQQKDQAAKPH